MSPFSEPLIVIKVRDRLWETFQEFTYKVDFSGENNIITVPAGFLTDFASVPRLFWPLIPPDGQYSQAAVVHDFLYSIQDRVRSECDEIFLEAMAELRVPKWKRAIMFQAVRAFGWIPWRLKFKGVINVEAGNVDNSKEN